MPSRGELITQLEVKNIYNMHARQHRRSVLPAYFAITYLALLWLNSGNVDFAAARTLGTGSTFFIANAILSYNLMYLMPAMLLTWLAGRPAVWRWLRLRDRSAVAAEVTAVATAALTTLLFYANAKLKVLYGMYINGFVINLVTTPGGLESLGGSNATNIGFALIALAFLAAQVALLLALKWLQTRLPVPFAPRRLALPLALLFVVSTAGDRVAYAYANAVGKSDMMVLTQGVPYYVSTTARTIFRKLGYTLAPQDKGVKIDGQLHYPAHPLQISKPAKPYNIVWLVSESWRADTLDNEIMPATSAFAAQAQNFKLHYSGGNGTRIGIFTMISGIPGSYWQPFYESHSGAAIIDVLQQQDYQMSLYTSAKFSYPEFDQTIFSKVPRKQLHEIDGPGAGWEKDRKNVSDLLDFIDKRDPSRPFFTFMFFESPHARYYFPPESVIRRPYRDDINYAALDQNNLREDIGPIKNRYLNSVHHLDSQFARVFDYLKAHGLLDNTIVVATGDHGEEFMEHGYWGHNSTFSDPQTRTPLVLWIPGQAPAVHGKLTSHLDLPATIMPLLGVKNPVEDYSTGLDLMSKAEHDYVVLSDWSHVGYRDQLIKVTLPMAQGGLDKKIVGPHDEKLVNEQAQALFQQQQPHLVRMLQDIGKYTRKPS